MARNAARTARRHRWYWSFNSQTIGGGIALVAGLITVLLYLRIGWWICGWLTAR